MSVSVNKGLLTVFIMKKYVGICIFLWKYDNKWDIIKIKCVRSCRSRDTCERKHLSGKGTYMNIGLLLGSVVDDFSNALCRGAENAARELGENLIVIPGKYLGQHSEDPMDKFEYQYNVLFSYGKSRSLDALMICAPTIASDISREARRAFLEEFGEIPIVTVASKEGYPSVTFDNRSGLIQAMDYLIHTMGKKRFGMISGRFGNEDAKERYEVVKLFLEANQLEFGDDQVVFSGMDEWSGDAAVKLLDQNPDMEVMICTNDAMALGAYEEIKRRGLQIGQDIYVLGFDDIEGAANADPPLATVHADAMAMGHQAFMSAYRYVAWNKEMNPTIQTSFVPRESVGYFHTDAENDILQFVANLNTDSDAAYSAGKVVEYLLNGSGMSADVTQAREAFTDFYSLYFQMILEDHIDERKIVELLRRFKVIVRAGLLDTIDTLKFKEIVELAMYQVLEKQHSKTDGRLVVQLNAQMDHRIFEYVQQNIQRERYERRGLMFHVTRNMRDTLMMNVDAEASYSTLLHDIYRLEVTRSYIYVFDRPMIHEPGDAWKLPEEMLLKAYTRGETVYSVPRTKQRIPVNRLFRNQFFDERDVSCYIVLDLFVGPRQYGILVCDLPCKYYSVVDILSYQFSVAVRIIQMTNRVRELRNQLEESQEALVEHRISMKVTGLTDPQTGLFNRAGFRQQVESLLQQAGEQEKYIVVAHADIDYLKRINHQFGHEEGDAAVQGAVAILRKLEGQGMIVGRVSGDGFGIAFDTDDPNDAELMRERLESATEEYNHRSGKHYNVRHCVPLHERTPLGRPAPTGG